MEVPNSGISCVEHYLTWKFSDIGERLEIETLARCRWNFAVQNHVESSGQS